MTVGLITGFWILFVSPLVACDIEGGWKGIQVLKTERTEVERLLGRRPAEEVNGEARFVTDEAWITVLYSTEPCSESKTLRGGFKVPRNTVLEYDVVPRGDLLFRDLGRRADLYSRWEDDHVIGFVHYYNKKSAIRLSTRVDSAKKLEYVHRIYFGRTEEQKSALACP